MLTFVSAEQNKKEKKKKNHLLHAGVISKASETHQSYQSVRDDRPSKHCHLHKHTHTYAHTCTPADRYVPLTSHWPLYEVINLLKRLGSFFMAGVVGSRQDSKRVHVHLMAHERTMAAALSASQAPAALGWALTPVDGWAVGINGWISHGGEIRQHFSDDFWVRYRLSLNQPADQSSAVWKGWKKWVWMRAVVYSSFRAVFWFISLDRREFKPIISERGATVLANHPGNLNLGFRLGDPSLTLALCRQRGWNMKSIVTR